MNRTKKKNETKRKMAQEAAMRKREPFNEDERDFTMIITRRW